MSDEVHKSPQNMHLSEGFTLLASYNWACREAYKDQTSHTRCSSRISAASSSQMKVYWDLHPRESSECDDVAL